MKDKLIAIAVGIFILLVVSGMLYLTIKYPRPYPGFEHQTPPVYPHYPPIA